MKQTYKVNVENYTPQLRLLMTMAKLKIIKHVASTMTTSHIPVHILGSYEVAEYNERITYIIGIEI
jgi:hypothetical protein